MNNIKLSSVDCHVVYWEADIPQFLTIKRGPNERYPLIWQCITGGIKPNEKAFEAAIRELKEETGLIPIKMWTIDRVNNYYDPKYDKVFLIPIFGIEVRKKDLVLSNEHIDYYWGSFEKVKDKILFHQQKEGLNSFHKMLTKETRKLHISEITIK